MGLKGIVFEGGGAKGAYQIGAVKALQEMGYEFDAIAGTSVGALNGAAVAQDDISKAYDIWSEIEPDKIFKTNEFQEARKNKASFIKLIKKIIEERGLDTEPLNEIIRNFIDEERIRRRNKIFGLVTVSLQDIKPFEIYLNDIPLGKLCDYVLASANFPLFKRARINGKKFSDGGLYNNYPINMLIDKGVRDIVSVRTFALGIVRSYDLKDSEVVNIEPKEKLGPILDFSKDRINKNLKLGYFDAQQVIKGYLGKRYYIVNDIEDDYFHKKLLAIDNSSLMTLAKDLGEGNMDPRRFQFEVLLPKIAEYLGLDKSTGYLEIILSIFEKLAIEENIERFKIYRYSEFVRIVAKSFEEYENIDILKNLPVFLTKKDLLTRNIKYKLLKEIAIKLIKENI